MRPVEIDDALLTEVAQHTGGRYFRAPNAAALQRITQQIDRLERTPVRTRTYTRYTELYRWPLVARRARAAGGAGPGRVARAGAVSERPAALVRCPRRGARRGA